MRLVRQEHPYGCVVATTAMLLDLTYAEAFALFEPVHGDIIGGAGRGGLGDFQLESLLVERGFAVAKRYRTMQPGNVKREVWPVLPWSDHRYYALVVTRCGGPHSVAVRSDGVVLDPGLAEPTTLDAYKFVNSITAVVPML